jgi:hypothetical protein
MKPKKINKYTRSLLHVEALLKCFERIEYVFLVKSYIE